MTKTTEADDLIRLSDAANLEAFPVPPAYRNLWRWVDSGLKARSGEVVKLRAVRVGRVYHTRPSWVREFVEATG